MSLPLFQTVPATPKNPPKRGELSAGAAALLRRLRAGPVVLADLMSLTTSAGEVGRWADELGEAGYPVAAELRYELVPIRPEDEGAAGRVGAKCLKELAMERSK